ncbi:MAG TPA: Gfo/Idh/MocA family oxidoreductase [Candidatus Acidoferrales bacterium]|nr:Gfo/Idh/MocA family oxidoreductase [Candidatus Acidoferrales bacterium]
MLRIGISGFGHWGPNYARILAGPLPGARLVACVDRSAEKLAQVRAQYPDVRIYSDHRRLIAEGDLEAVIVATPTSTHRALVEDFLEAGLHVLVEKPMATTAADAEAMVELAEARQRVLMVGHTFLFNPAVRLIKQYIDDGLLGEVLYLYFHRTGLGPIRQDVNALWDLAPHDLSMLRYWLGAEPVDLVCRGEAYLKHATEDVVFLTLRYPNNVIASIHVSWLDPVKERRATVVGDKKMVVFDDVHATEKLRVYDKGANYLPAGGEFAEFVAAVRDGDILIPKVSSAEPLREQLMHFIDCVRHGRRPLTDGQDGLSAVRILEQAQAELERTAAPAVAKS